MEQLDIQELIHHPEKMDSSTLLYLRKLVARYPYFQTAWMLYLKNLFIVGAPNFKDELKRGALFVADLSLLFYYIEGERFLIKKHETEGQNASVGSDRTLDLIDRFLSELPEQGIQQNPVTEMSIPMEMPADYTSVLLAEVSDEEKETTQLQGHELIDQFLEHTENVSVELQTSDTPSQNKEEDVEDIAVDEQPAPDEQSEVQQEDDSEESYFTETLAKIYVRQQRYDKALEIIKKLNLKYPKKNAYFADQIRFLEKLIINAKSK